MQDLAILSEDVNEVAHAYTSSVPCLVIISDRTLVGWSVARENMNGGLKPGKGQGTAAMKKTWTEGK